jgi:hypothetical protein
VYSFQGQSLLDQLNSPWLLHEYGHAFQMAVPSSPESLAVVKAYNELNKTGIVAKRSLGSDPYAFTNNREYFACLTEGLTTPVGAAITGGGRRWPKNGEQLQEDDLAGYTSSTSLWKMSAADIAKVRGGQTIQTTAFPTSTLHPLTTTQPLRRHVTPTNHHHPPPPTTHHPPPKVQRPWNVQGRAGGRQCRWSAFSRGSCCCSGRLGGCNGSAGGGGMKGAS